MTEPCNTGLLRSGPAVSPAESEVLLFGELLADRFPDGERIGGAPFNVARHLKAFGLNPRLVSRIGADGLGQRLLGLLTAWDMDITGIQVDCHRPTGRVQVHIDEDAHRFEILPDQAYDHIDAERALRFAEAANPALFYFGTLIQRQEASRQALETLLEPSHTPRLLDLNLRPPWVGREIVETSLAAADVLKLNRDELMEVARLLEMTSASPEHLAAEIMIRFSLKQVLVTAGAEGAWLIDAGGRETRAQGHSLTEFPPPAPCSMEDGGQSVLMAALNTTDTVGAGDAFAAVFMLGMLSDWPAPVTLQRADAFARDICGIRGAVPMDDAFYEPFLTAWKRPRDSAC